MENESLWAKILLKKYSQSTPAKPSLWWQDLKKNCFSEGEGGWFETNICRKVRRGNETLFWEDTWLHGEKLRDKYPRLFDLSSNKKGLLMAMEKWTEGIWNWELGWRRNLRDPELSVLNSLLTSIHTFTPRVYENDGWTWSRSEDGIYSVSIAYSVLLGSTQYPSDVTFKFLWSVPAPLIAYSVLWFCCLLLLIILFGNRGSQFFCSIRSL